MKLTPNNTDYETFARTTAKVLGVEGVTLEPNEMLLDLCNLNHPNIKSRFERRYKNDSREWITDTTIDNVLDNIKTTQLEYYGGWHLKDEFYVRHCLYCCGSSPIDKLCWDLNDFQKIIDFCSAGDILMVWVLAEDNPIYYRINCPDENGLFPLKGAY